jgi:hypothetical protein
MTQSIVTYYEKVGKRNLNKSLARRRLHREVLSLHDECGASFSREEMIESLNQVVRDHEGRAVVILEIPAESYFETNAASVYSLLNNGLKGVYLSFQRPYNNICSLFEQQGIDMDNLLVVDAATALCGCRGAKNPGCVDVPFDTDVYGMADMVYSSLLSLKGGKRFVFVDSLSTIALHEPLPKVRSFSEFLIRKVRENAGCEDVLFIFNVAAGLSRNICVDNVATYSDEFIHLGLCA